MNMNEFEAFWADRQPDRSDMAEFWSRRAQSFNSHSSEADSSTYRRNLVEKVAARANVGEADAVLDIGCGPGRHSLIFAGLAGSVDGFDIAPGMIECANENARQAGMENARFCVLDWERANLEQLGWQKRFQLVFASRTPAVYDRATLEKMTDASRGYCCLITQVTGENSVRRELAPVVGAANHDEYTRRGLYCAFNILWLQGYYPEVEYLERSWDSECPLEEAIIMYTRHFNSRGQLTAAQQAALAGNLRAMSKNGMVHETGSSRVGMLFWNANR